MEHAQYKYQNIIIKYYIYFTIDVDRLIIKIREKSDFIFKVTKKAVVEVIYAGKVSK